MKLLFIVALLVTIDDSLTTVVIKPPRVRRLPLTMAGARRKMVGSASEAVVIKIREPNAKPGGRPAPAEAYSLPESSIVRLKPMIRFHRDSNPRTLSNTTQEPFYKKMNEINLHKMADFLLKTNLTEELRKTGPITIFAPTDEAFSLAERGLIENLQSADNTLQMREFLLHHVIRGHMYPNDVRNDFVMPSIHPSGAPLRFNVYNGGQVITVSGAQMLNSGTLVDDVLIQPIDRLLYPRANSSIIRKTRESYSEMHDFMHRSGLQEQVDSGTFTVFSPTNEAFSILPLKARDLLFHNATLLRKLMLNHIVPGSYFSTVLSNGYRLKPLGGGVLIFTTRRGLILVNGVPILSPDIPTTNGVIHGINRVLVPDDLIEMCKCMAKYPLVPATLKPLPSPNDSPPTDQKDEDNPEQAFGTRLKKPTDNENEMKETKPTTIYPPDKMNRRTALVNLLNEPMHLPDGQIITFNIAAPLFKRTIIFNTLRYPGNMGCTVLLPSDEAFGRLQPNVMTRLHRDRQRLTHILQWHVLEGTLDFSALNNNTRLKTLSGGTLPITVLPGKVFLIGGLRILGFRPGFNGAVFAVDGVFDPPPEDKDMSDEVKSQVDSPTDDLSIWRKLIDDVPDLKKQLKSRDRMYTMFAVTNTAFAQLRPNQLQRLFQEDDLKRDLIRSHVLEGAIYKNTLLETQTFSTLSGNQLQFNLSPDGFIVNNIPITRPGILTRNGLVYVVNNFLIYPDNFNHSRSLSEPEYHLVIKSRSQEPFSRTLEELARLYNATTFLKWIHASGLRSLIRPENPCTIFLPTNQAIDLMSPTIRMSVIENRKALRRFVQYHICETPISSMDDLSQDLLLPTLLPKKTIRCNSYRNSTMFTASGCPIIQVIAPINAVSLIIIEKPLSPPVGDLFLTMSKSPMLRNFTKIVRVAEMENELRSGVYTVFAPSKCAFGQMTSDEYERLLTDKNIARAFVLRHLVRNCYYTSGMYDNMELKTLADTTLRLNTTLTECIVINGIKLKYGDMNASNGVLHIVSDFL